MSVVIEKYNVDDYRAELIRREALKRGLLPSKEELEAKALERYRAAINPTDVQIEVFRTNIKTIKYGIYNKGRRLGMTRGAGEAFPEYILQGMTVLWIDVIQGNIRRYFEEFIEKALKKAGFTSARRKSNIGPFEYHFDKMDLILRVGTAGGKCDFRSADYADRIEGFGYDLTFFNEAGFILNSPAIWNNSVMPMMVDNPDSVTIVAGTPKLTQGKGRFFQELAVRRDECKAGYGGRRIESYENPHLTAEGLQALKDELTIEGFDASTGEQQEIKGMFVDVRSLGDFFMIRWFKEVETSPLTRVVRGWDLASTPVSEQNPDPDYTFSCGLDVHDAGLTIFDTDFCRLGPTGVDLHMLIKLREDLSLCKDVTYVIPLDPASAGKVAYEHYEKILMDDFKEFLKEPIEDNEKLLRQREYTFKVMPYTQTANKGSKAQRAKPAANLSERGEISYVNHKKVDTFFFQLSTFPSEEKGVHDDAPDAFAAAVNSVGAKPKKTFGAFKW